MSNAGPVIGKEDEFEQAYTERFRTLVSAHGIFMKYERDRAALDVGLRLTDPNGVMLGADWWEEEATKHPLAQHPIARWHAHVEELMNNFCDLSGRGEWI